MQVGGIQHKPYMPLSCCRILRLIVLPCRHSIRKSDQILRSSDCPTSSVQPESLIRLLSQLIPLVASI